MPQFVLTERLRIHAAANYTPSLICHVHSPIFCVSKEAFYQMLHINVNSTSYDFGFHRFQNLWKKFLIEYVCYEYKKQGSPLTKFSMSIGGDDTYMLLTNDTQIDERSRQLDDDLLIGEHKISDNDRKEFYDNVHKPSIEKASRNVDHLIEPLRNNAEIFAQFVSRFDLLQI